MSGEEAEKMIEAAHGWDPNRPRMSEADVQKHPWAAPLPVGHAETKLVLDEVLAERLRQDQLFGPQSLPNGTGGGAAYRNACQSREVVESAKRYGSLAWSNLLGEEFWEAMAETDPAKLRAELIQVAAVAVAWAEALMP